MKKFFVVLFVMVFVLAANGQNSVKPIHHTEVYYEAGRFAGWPANNGIWSWGNEIVVGFSLGYYKENPRRT